MLTSCVPEGNNLASIMPAKAGIQGEANRLPHWIPAFAGMTEAIEVSEHLPGETCAAYFPLGASKGKCDGRL